MQKFGTGGIGRKILFECCGCMGRYGQGLDTSEAMLADPKPIVSAGESK
jgi:hypothetical protein